MSKTVLYDDGKTVLDEHGVTLRHYYFPLGTSKHIAYRMIRGIEQRPMSWSTGKGRGWGTASARYWLPLDLSRWRKTTLIVLDLGKTVKPSFTPDKPDLVLRILHDHV